MEEEKLIDVVGGRLSSENEFDDFLNAMDQVDGKNANSVVKLFLKRR